MDDPLARAIAAHGGFDRSNKFNNKVTATVVRTAGWWPMKCLEPDLNPPASHSKERRKMRTKEKIYG
jgi:hypothetical protein